MLEDLIQAGEHACMTTPDSGDPLRRFDAEMLNRGVNSAKSVQLLIEQAHWETASAVVRQLFELLVNMEYVSAQDDRGAAVLKYCKFGLLQNVLARQRRATYDVATGRPVDAAYRSLVDQLLTGDAFDEFRAAPKADGSVRWRDSWSGHKTRYLAEQSVSPMRMHQYELLYTLWSEQAHAAPGAFINDLFRDTGPEWVEDAVRENDTKILETIAMTATLFCDLWKNLPGVPEVDPQRALSWTSRLMEQMKSADGSLVAPSEPAE
ncbi:DUF5677 domain-containing protein [Streptomycetaceae bacterium NBC_01309]